MIQWGEKQYGISTGYVLFMGQHIRISIEWKKDGYRVTGLKTVFKDFVTAKATAEKWYRQEVKRLCGEKETEG